LLTCVITRAESPADQMLPRRYRGGRVTVGWHRWPWQENLGSARRREPGGYLFRFSEVCWFCGTACSKYLLLSLK